MSLRDGDLPSKQSPPIIHACNCNEISQLKQEIASLQDALQSQRALATLASAASADVTYNRKYDRNPPRRNFPD